MSKISNCGDIWILSQVSSMKMVCELVMVRVEIVRTGSLRIGNKLAICC